ncbi:MAG: dihydrolipoyl dehydrogenase [Clostridia bacterium]|nr:dihydrolipoyl dehydrogenase [Clostridia bacterium]
MAETIYDLIILGGGPAGYNAAERAAHAGMKTLLFEERALGGVCLNEGCIPTKTLLYSAKILDYAHHGEAYGVTVTGASLDHAKVVDRKDKVVKTLVSGVGAKMRGAGVTVVTSTAKITGKTASGFAVEADGKTYEAKKLLVCTGSEAVVPPIPGLRESYAGGLAVTNREILDLRTAPGRIVVVGGGVIGLEMASYFCSIGSEVTVVEMLDKIAGPTEAEISKILQKNYEKRGVKFILGAKVTAVNGKPGDGVVSYEKDGKGASVACDLVLVSTGRRARTRDIGLEEVGVQLNRGAVVTDERCRTSVPGIWAAGDVNGKIMLAHTAYREGEVAVSDMLGRADRVDYRAIPSVIYTNPEVGSVGETVESAKKAGIDAEEATLSLRYSGRYVAENEGGDGIVKVVYGKEHREILGVHMIGSYASEIIYGAAAMVAKKQRVSDVEKLVFPHPTVCEAIREAMFTIK